MKRILMAVAVVGFLGFAGIQIASARGGYGPGDGYGYCNQNYDDDDTKGNAAFTEFRAATTEIRKSIIVKRSELQALMSQDNPDEKRVAQLTGEIFDLENDLDKKATEKGITGRSHFGHGLDMMRGNGGGYGPDMMRGNGRGYGRHMMDW